LRTFIVLARRNGEPFAAAAKNFAGVAHSVIGSVPAWSASAALKGDTHATCVHHPDRVHGTHSRDDRV